jgi:tetratricopeptide (TPR) repeat protein
MSISFYEKKMKTTTDPFTIACCLNDIGTIYLNQANYEKALYSFKQILNIKRDVSIVYDNISTCHFHRKEYKLCEMNLLISLKLNPKGEAPSKLGFLMYCLKQLDKSIDYYKQSYSSDHILYTSSYSYLAKQDYRTGFSLYEKRFHENAAENGQKKRLEINLPDWDGKECEHLLVVYEQGIGDNILYYRFLIQLSNLYPMMRITYLCRDFLMNVFEPHDKIQVVYNMFGVYSHKVFIMSLPYYLKIDTIVPNQEKYIHVKEEKCIEWKQKLPQSFKIGIFYKGLLKSYVEKTIPLCDFEPLTELGTLICMHRLHEVEEDVKQILFRDKVLAFDIDKEPFVDTIAILKNIDVLITVDSSLAHLAGALNIKTILLVGYIHDWRWYTKWYDSVHVLCMTENKELKYILPEVKTLLSTMV